MGMALKVDVTEAVKDAGVVKPIDLVHLSKLTMGDRDLELEVLKMFLVQIPYYLDTIKSARTPDEVYVAAHTIKGASVNVGAFHLADLARDAENSGDFPLQDILDEMARITEYVSMLSSEA